MRRKSSDHHAQHEDSGIADGGLRPTSVVGRMEIVKTGDASLVEEINRDGFGKYEKSLA